MTLKTVCLPRWLNLLLAFLLLSASCQRRTPPATDSKSLQKHAEELKKQYERERKNE
jgi:hypothetical protein